ARALSERASSVRGAPYCRGRWAAVAPGRRARGKAWCAFLRNQLPKVILLRLFPSARTTMRKAVLTAAVLGGLSFSAMAQPPVQAPACDRACLEGYLDKYLVAMMNKDVSDELFAREVKFTENGVRLPLNGNEGLWWGMTGTEGYKFYVPDLETQQVAFIGTVK